MYLVKIVLFWLIALVAIVVEALAIINGWNYIVYASLAVIACFFAYMLRLCWIDRHLKMPEQSRYSGERLRVWRKLQRVRRMSADFSPELCRQIFRKLDVPTSYLLASGNLTVGYANWLLGILAEIGGDAELVFGLGSNDCAFWVQYCRGGRLWRVCCYDGYFSGSETKALLSDYGFDFDAYSTVSYLDICQTLKAASNKVA